MMYSVSRVNEVNVCESLISDPPLLPLLIIVAMVEPDPTAL